MTQSGPPLALAPQKGILFLGEIENASFVREIWEAHLALPKDKAIRIFIDSDGGDCYESFAIISAIKNVRREGRKVIGHVGSRACSMATVILQSCSTRTAEADSLLLIHEISYDAAELTITGHEIELVHSRKLLDTMCAYYAHRSPKGKKFFLDKVKGGNDWLLSAQEALELGLLDDILTI